MTAFGPNVVSFPTRRDGFRLVYFRAPKPDRPRWWRPYIALPLGTTGAVNVRDEAILELIRRDAATLQASLSREWRAQQWADRGHPR